MLHKFQKNILSISKFAQDNTCYFEFHPHYFVIKDLQTYWELLRGPVKDGLHYFKLNDRCQYSLQALLIASDSISL